MCWIGFCVPVVLEVYVHVLRGFSREEILAEEDKLPKQMSVFLDFSELICRVCLAQVMVATVFFMARAVLHNKVRQGWKQLCGTSPRQYLPGLLVSLVTFSVGLWGCLVGDEGLPLWALLYSHVCDIFCHAIVSSALMGLGFDLLVAIYKGKLMDFLKKFVRCDDTIEAHGVYAEEPLGEMHDYSFHDSMVSPSRSESRNSFCRLLRRALQFSLMWASWIFIFISYTLAWFRPDLAPQWMQAMVDFIGRFCWAGISFWIVSSIAGIGMNDSSASNEGHSNGARPATMDVIEAMGMAGMAGMASPELISCQDCEETAAPTLSPYADGLRMYRLGRSAGTRASSCAAIVVAL